jgi:hypothetical protein
MEPPYNRVGRYAVRSLLTSMLVATVAGFLGGIAAIVVGVLVLVTFFDLDLTGDEPPREQERVERAIAYKLAADLAPVIRLHSSERFLPIDRALYLLASDLMVSVGREKPRVVMRSPPESTLPEDHSGCPELRPCAYFFDVRGIDARPRGAAKRYVRRQDRLLGTRSPTVYWHATRYVDSGEVALSYWFLYIFNNYTNVHEADWERVTIRLDSKLKPKEVFFSAHVLGHSAPWESLRKVGEHVAVYPAGGSHGNYSDVGTYDVQLHCLATSVRASACVSSRLGRDSADGCGRVLYPRDLTAAGPELRRDDRCHATGEQFRYQLRRLARPVFIGLYGPGNFVGRKRVGGGPRDPQARVDVRDPLRGLERARPPA